MQFISYSNPKILIADEGKKIRAINDVHADAYIDEDGNMVDEHYPYYSDIVFIANEVKTLAECQEMYVEEEK